jgi:hypothetical protein
MEIVAASQIGENVRCADLRVSQQVYIESFCCDFVFDFLFSFFLLIYSFIITTTTFTPSTTITTIYYYSCSGHVDQVGQTCELLSAVSRGEVSVFEATNAFRPAAVTAAAAAANAKPADIALNLNFVDLNCGCPIDMICRYVSHLN